MKIIIGAGLSGLICGALNAQSKIFERNPSNFISHKAVLRFRDDKIARSLGLTFRKVRVRKGIWMDGPQLSAPLYANLYSQKVRGIIGDGSIWNLEPSDRFIAPENLHELLADICGNRITWQWSVSLEQILDWRKAGLQIVNTSPLPVILELLSMASPFSFSYAPIFVSRYRVPDCDVFQSIYFPEPSLGLYRATLTGDLLTLESVSAENTGMNVAMDAFGLRSLPFLSDPADLKHKQSFGKIIPAPDGPRKALLHRLTQEWGIYSLGRFATWRNILLDDVYEDIAVIRRMMTQQAYDNSLERTRT